MVKSRPAVVGEKLVSHNFGMGTTGFASVEDKGVGSCKTAVCILPGTELSFDAPLTKKESWDAPAKRFEEKVARFRQLNKDEERTHHDVLELADGTQVYLTHLEAGQVATVLQLPAAPKNGAEAEEQRRVEVVG